MQRKFFEDQTTGSGYAQTSMASNFEVSEMGPKLFQAEVHVYMQTNMITYIVESPDYPLTQMLGELGGVIGLYIGMTIATLFELLELLCLLVYIFVRRITGYVTEGEMSEALVKKRDQKA